MQSIVSSPNPKMDLSAYAEYFSVSSININGGFQIKKVKIDGIFQTTFGKHSKLLSDLCCTLDNWFSSILNLQIDLGYHHTIDSFIKRN